MVITTVAIVLRKPCFYPPFEDGHSLFAPRSPSQKGGIRRRKSIRTFGREEQRQLQREAVARDAEARGRGRKRSTFASPEDRDAEASDPLHQPSYDVDAVGVPRVSCLRCFSNRTGTLASPTRRKMHAKLLLNHDERYERAGTNEGRFALLAPFFCFSLFFLMWMDPSITRAFAERSNTLSSWTDSIRPPEETK